MNAQMMNYPLTLDRMLVRANTVYAEQEIVSRMADESIHRYTFKDFYKRVLKLMNALRKLGVKPGDRVATFAWNNYRHMEIYFAVPAIGAVLHTLNIRLFPEQLVYIVNHAEDKLIFVDKSLIKPLAAQQEQLKTIENYVVMNDGAPAPDVALKPTLDYENLLADAESKEDFAKLDENAAAAMCYTSGTTGEPKGVVYSHRSTFLHTMTICMQDTLALSMRDSVLPVVPMFHVNAWGIPFACALTGVKPVYPGPHLIGKPVAELIQDEKVTLAAGVPSIWNALYQFLKKSDYDISSLRGLVIGGSAAPQSLIDGFLNDFNVEVIHAWGMTEMSPIGTLCAFKPQIDSWPAEKKAALRAKQGLPVPLVEARIMGDDGQEQPFNGKDIGELQVRGPWVASSYYKTESAEANAAFTEDGWFGTGDIVTIDELGYMQITDRKKDLIKTRGEWLSTVDMENSVMALEQVLEAAVIGRHDDVRGEAVVLYVVPFEGQSIEPKSIIDYLSDKFAKWQIPKTTDIHLVESIPKTSVGKFDKKVLRKQLAQG